MISIKRPISTSPSGLYKFLDKVTSDLESRVESTVNEILAVDDVVADLKHYQSKIYRERDVVCRAYPYAKKAIGDDPMIICSMLGGSLIGGAVGALTLNLIFGEMVGGIAGMIAGGALGALSLYGYLSNWNNNQKQITQMGDGWKKDVRALYEDHFDEVSRQVKNVDSLTYERQLPEPDNNLDLTELKNQVPVNS